MEALHLLSLRCRGTNLTSKLCICAALFISELYVILQIKFLIHFNK